MSQRYVQIFSRFERFWHWTQMALIMMLLVTGFNIHGLYFIVDFELAVKVHILAAVALIILWLFAIFWHLTTGTWKHYIPTSNGLFKVAYYYAYGIFKNEEHPYKKTYRRKHNPLQAMAYLALKVLLFPAIWLSGMAYLTYTFWGNASSSGAIEWVAVIHTISAFAIAIFVIVHVYLLTTGHSFKEHVMPMLSGFDKVDLTDEEVAFLESDQPENIR